MISNKGDENPSSRESSVSMTQAKARRKDRRLSDLFKEGEDVSAPISPNFRQSFEYQKNPVESNNDDSLFNMPLLHLLWLSFKDNKIEHKFIKDYYFGDNVYCWRVICVFLVEALLYTLWQFQEDKMLEHQTIFVSMRFFMIALHIFACFAIILKCHWESIRKRKKMQQKKPEKYADHEKNTATYQAANFVEKVILVVMSLSLSATMEKQHIFFNYSQAIHVGAYLHIWASLTMLRPRFIIVSLISIHTIVSWIIFSFQWRSIEGRIFLLHFFGLICFISYILSELYGVERWMRRSFIANRREWVEQKLLEIEKKKSQTLLHNILPKSIIKDLKKNKIERINKRLIEGVNTIPSLNEIRPVVHRRDNISVLLSDIENFTEFSSTRSAEEVLLILNIQFSYFDVVCKKLRIEKVKTIGDAFMAVGGLDADSEHESITCLKKTVTMGCGFLRIIDLLNRKYNWNFHVRIGVAYGRVIASVMGQELLTFECFGPAVKEAQKMEKCAEADSILTTEKVYELTSNQFSYSKYNSPKASCHCTYMLKSPDTANRDGRITDLILDDSLHDLLNSIIEQQCQFAADRITVKHSQSELCNVPGAILSPPLVDAAMKINENQNEMPIPQVTTTDRNGDTTHVYKSSVIAHFAQSPLFQSEFSEKIRSDTGEDSPKVSSPESSNTTYVDTTDVRREKLDRLLKFKDMEEERRYLYENYKSWRVSMSAYLFGQVMIDLLSVLIPVAFSRYDLLLESYVMKVHYLAFAVHIISLYFVVFTRAYMKTLEYGVALSIVTLTFSAISCFAFATHAFTLIEIFPISICTLVHTLSVPPNLSFTLKLYMVIAVLLASNFLTLIFLSVKDLHILAYIYCSAICGLISSYSREWAIRNVALKKSMKEISKQKLRLEKQMSDNLILSVLLESTVERIRQGEINIFDNISDCSVCFMKICGMEELIEKADESSDVSALVQVFAFLDLMIQHFDSRLQENLCEKIKSVNNVYMAVCGISYEVPNHTEQLLLFAIDVCDLLKQLCDRYKHILRGIQLGLKIGLHSGPVSGGILGYHRFLYDIFGDTVNCSSRACSTSERINQVQMSEEVFLRVKDVLDKHNLTYEKRGPVQLKGKGSLNMYYIWKNSSTKA